MARTPGAKTTAAGSSGGDARAARGDRPQRPRDPRGGTATAGALYWTRGILTPLALAMFLAIMIDSFARRLEHRWPRLPDSLSLAVAIVLSLLIFGDQWSPTAPAASSARLVGYGPKIDGLIARMASMVVASDAAPGLHQMVDEFQPHQQAGEVLAQGLQGVVSDAVFVLIYRLHHRLAAGLRARSSPCSCTTPSAPTPSKSSTASASAWSATWVQTVTGLMIAGGSWLAMVIVGLDNASFWPS